MRHQFGFFLLAGIEMGPPNDVEVDEDVEFREGGCVGPTGNGKSLLYDVTVKSSGVSKSGSDGAY